MLLFRALFLNIFDFAQFLISNMAELKSLRDIEIAFIKENFEGIKIENDYCWAFFNGQRDGLESVLDKFFSINSTSFVKAEKHDRNKLSKRYSERGTLAIY